MKISEAMAQGTVTLNPGDYLAANTDSVGYLPTYKDTSDLHRGQYLFKVVSADSGLDVIPVVMAEDGKSFVEVPERPIISQRGNVISYMTTRNDPIFKDGYRPAHAHVVENIPSGEEARNILATFIAFVGSEYGMGVNDFNIEGPDYLNTGAAPEEPAPEEPAPEEPAPEEPAPEEPQA
ncbi:Ig domain containing protein [Bacillus phage phiNIT1]|uniref:Uncharacterized protein n=1 Tax=Bacillus phage phiNIT1 TaxID=207656 RepID=S6ATS1_9CAUD|nr:Ig domain containing protein [Bacillus phage phiNIT1]BAN59631.1 hypothetical protein [Bacillus phage phiNIT1]